MKCQAINTQIYILEVHFVKTKRNKKKTWNKIQLACCLPQKNYKINFDVIFTFIQHYRLFLLFAVCCESSVSALIQASVSA